MADSYVRAGDFQKAIQLLEQLYEESPRNRSFYRKLKDAYESVKRYEDALELVQARIDRAPTPERLSEKARLLHLKGSRKKANQMWDRALALEPQKAKTYRVVYQTLLNMRQFNKAIDVLKKGRESLEDPDVFRTELARLYGLAGKHDMAMEEYVSLLANAPQRTTFVQNRLQTFVEQGEGIQASLRVLNKAVEESPENRAYRQLLAWLHMEVSDYEAALDVYRTIDRLENTRGRVLLDFGRKAVQAREYAVAAKAFSSVVNRYPKSEITPNVQYALGNAYRQWSQSNPDSSNAQPDSTLQRKAVTAYRTFLESYPNHEHYPDVLLKLGTLFLDVYRDLDRAEETLQHLVENHSQTPVAQRGEFHLARIALFRDSLDRAKRLFSRVGQTAQESALANRAHYELARLHFYRGEFESATSRSQAISQHPETDAANDALALNVLIQENQGPDSLHTALRLFAKARLYDRQHRYEAALTTVDTLLQRHPSHALSDDAQFQRAEIQLARRDTAAALESFKALVERYPRSPYADRSLYRVGSVLESRGRENAAIEAYNKLLAEYPKSLRAADARSRLRALLRTSG